MENSNEIGSPHSRDICAGQFALCVDFEIICKTAFFLDLTSAAVIALTVPCTLLIVRFYKYFMYL